MGLTKENWVWMPHSGHLIVGSKCRFHLNTYVGDYIVSTVGEYVPDSVVQKIIYEMRYPGKKLPQGDAGEHSFLKENGYEEIGVDRTYETMVFKAREVEDSCCPYRMVSGFEVDFKGYSDSKSAFEGHLKLCEKWSKEEAPNELL